MSSRSGVRANGEGSRPPKRAREGQEGERKRRKETKSTFQPRPIGPPDAPNTSGSAADDDVPLPPPPSEKILRRRESTRLKYAAVASPAPTRRAPPLELGVGLGLPLKQPRSASAASGDGSGGGSASQGEPERPRSSQSRSRHGQHGSQPETPFTEPPAIPHLNFKQARRPRPSAAPPPSPGPPRDMPDPKTPASKGSRRPRKSRAPEVHVDSVVPLPISDTPVIDKNRELRRVAEAERRSSLGMRGQRASGSFGRGEPTYPHASVPASQFYKHIATDLPDPVKVRYVIAWSAKRALDESLARDKKGKDKGKQRAYATPEVDRLAGNVVDAFVARIAKGDVDTNVFGSEDRAKSIPAKPHPRNVENHAVEANLKSLIRKMKVETAAWQTLLNAANKAQKEVVPALRAKKEAAALPHPTAVGGAVEAWFARALERADAVLADTPSTGTPGQSLAAPDFGAVERQVDTLRQATHQGAQYVSRARAFLDGVFAALAADLRQDPAPAVPRDEGPDTVALLAAAARGDGAGAGLGAASASGLGSRPDPMTMLRALARADADTSPETLAKAAAVPVVPATPRRVGRRSYARGTTPGR